MSCGIVFTAQELYDREVLATMSVPHLPIVWPRCPECFGKLHRVSLEGITDWRCA